MPAEIVIVADVWVTEKMRDRALALLREDIEYTHANESGVARFALHRDTEDPLHFVMIETFADEATLAAHRASDFYKQLMAQLDEGGVLARRGRVVLEPVGYGDPEKGYLA
jgi:quinol monooxygenase YgiN